MTSNKNTFGEYDDIVSEMSDTNQNDVMICQDKDEKLDTILNELLDLKKTVTELTEVVTKKTEHIESMENIIKETKDITSKTYKAFNKTNNTNILTTITD